VLIDNTKTSFLNQGDKVRRYLITKRNPLSTVLPDLNAGRVLVEAI
jgi:hypothetical protein